MANNTLNTILANQNVEYRANKAQRESIDTQLTQALANLNTLANRVYGYTHSAVVTDDLEKDYQDIITANPDLENVSAVGLLAILSDGDTVTAQGNRMFINGTEEQSDYSFSGENSQNGIEFVKIWFFEKDGSLSLTESFEYDVNEIQCVYKSAVPVIPNSYFDVPSVYVNFVPANLTVSNAVKKITYETNSTGIIIPNSAKEATYYCTELSSNDLVNKTNLKKLNLPMLEVITADSNGFSGCTNLKEINYPKLRRIENHTYSSSTFKNVPQVVLPESLQYVGNECISTGTKRLTLNCKNAQIDGGWAYNATYQGNRTEYFEMCSDWGASIPIQNVSMSWVLADYIDLLTNKLRDMTATEETRTLTIPSAMLTAMQADTDGLAAIEAATDKGWTIGGA